MTRFPGVVDLRVSIFIALFSSSISDWPCLSLSYSSRVGVAAHWQRVSDSGWLAPNDSETRNHFAETISRVLLRDEESALKLPHHFVFLEYLQFIKSFFLSHTCFTNVFPATSFACTLIHASLRINTLGVASSAGCSRKNIYPGCGSPMAYPQSGCTFCGTDLS
ncbi:hypothetical protein C8R48DRAFT_706192 [Suillus tomentosus]|nr:hypothetical protein C8R48DRAFT_706192 [Suillus tomentosus]